MLRKTDIKLIKSLGEKANRNTNKLFVAEGSKSVMEILQSEIETISVYALPEWINRNGNAVSEAINLVEISEKELGQISQLKSTRDVIALCRIPDQSKIPVFKGLTLALDTIQDPGNLGTLIRLADWYGIAAVLCSVSTVDCYNPKVVQATMGSIGRVSVFYGELTKWLESAEVPVIAATMEGKPSAGYPFPKDCILLIGNEGSGISQQLKPYVTDFVAIERAGRAESLNAAVAASILVDRHFVRQLS